MDSNEFVSIRQRLTKTQKELATLLGISLKAVCSYEQGWRSIPVHVERQLLFLLARKNQGSSTVTNCWELRNCPDENRLACPSWEFSAGQFCWFICGTRCDNITHASWEEKIQVCRKCKVFIRMFQP